MMRRRRRTRRRTRRRAEVRAAIAPRVAIGELVGIVTETGVETARTSPVIAEIGPEREETRTAAPGAAAAAGGSAAAAAVAGAAAAGARSARAGIEIASGRRTRRRTRRPAPRATGRSAPPSPPSPCRSFQRTHPVALCPIPWRRMTPRRGSGPSGMRWGIQPPGCRTGSRTLPRRTIPSPSDLLRQVLTHPGSRSSVWRACKFAP
mmetsp:Transcript_46045/g.109441  ORF Transcript_46045/g.109441 Transcript_46045/m.109441 type:complete len:206 (-) Transcript_46045:1173-1790(-)